VNVERVLYGLAAAASLPPGPRAVAIGAFDGVHRGHRAVVGAAVEWARRSGGRALALTFDPHPSRLFRPADPVRLMLPLASRARVLLGLGVDHVVVEPFTAEFAALEAEDFLPRLQRLLPGLGAVAIGENWRFGRNRRGDAAFLVEQGRRLGIEVAVAPSVVSGGERVSSTRIRRLLETGEIERANELLGSPYRSESVVTPGKQLGRTIGFPTLNLPWDPELRPRLGVYAVRVRRADAVAAELGLPGVANYGLRPTVERATAPRLEVHVLGSCPFGSGEALDVEWLHFLRAEQRFADLGELRAQIGRDRERAAAFFSIALG
jgi:riboflavin kinase/FMN adenylyltransferase